MHVFTLQRFHRNESSTVGALFLDGVFLCFILEDGYHTQKIYGATRIPSGTYPLGLRWSPSLSVRYMHKMIWIMEVPGFDYIYFHSGNKAKDTLGCPLCGDGIVRQEEGESYIVGGTSRGAYDRVYAQLRPLIDNGTLQTVTVADEPQYRND